MENKCVLAYASMSGNTAQMAQAIAQGIRENGYDLDVKEMYNTDASTVEK